MEPVVSGYLYLYMNGVRFATSATIPVSFSVVDATPGGFSDTPTYIANSPPIPACYALMAAQDQQSDPTAAFWQARDLVDKVKGVTEPTFLHEGFLEDNTKPDRVFDLYNNLAGPKRAWFGQWDHVRGYKDNDGKYYADRPHDLARGGHALPRPLRPRTAAGRRPHRQGPAGRHQLLRRQVAPASRAGLLPTPATSSRP